MLRIKASPKSTIAFDNDNLRGTSQQHEFANTLSFASPESDFTTSHVLVKSMCQDLDAGAAYKGMNQIENQSKEWSKTLSFASPESDFSSENVHPTSSKTINMNQNPKNNLDDERDKKETFFDCMMKESQNQSDFAYSLSFATPESDFTNPAFTELLNERMKKQLANTSSLRISAEPYDANQLTSFVNQRQVDDPSALRKIVQETQEEEILTDLEYHELRAHAELLRNEDSLPSTMEDATKPDETRAIVITEAQMPFRIVAVNAAWERLCGYTEHECRGETLSCIQGEDTNRGAITALMSQVLRGEEGGTVLTNYRKDGSKFSNRLRVGSLMDEHHKVTHFVGVLKEIEEMPDHFYEGSKILA